MVAKRFYVTTLAILLATQVLWAQKKNKSATGKELYKKYECVSCHGKYGKTPFDLTQAIEKYDEQKVKDYIKNPKNFGNTRMPSYEGRIAEDQYPELIEYIIKLGRQAQPSPRS
jgi:mono/diheme cytochrome c family protein